MRMILLQVARDEVESGRVTTIFFRQINRAVVGAAQGIFGVQDNNNRIDPVERLQPFNNSRRLFGVLVMNQSCGKLHRVYSW